jgi:flagellar export protein FliJ
MSARFRFRLQTVLDHRVRIVDERQRELAQKQRDLTEAQAVAAGLCADRESQRDALVRDHVRFDVETLRATYAHLAYLDRAIADHTVRVAACAAEVEQAQMRLVEANTDCKVLETLKTRRHEAFVAHAAQVDQRDADDLNARRYGRAHLTQGNEP